MNAKTPKETIDFKRFADRSVFDPPPKFFGQRASLSIAKWILYIFAGVLTLAFVVLFVLLLRDDVAIFEKAAELLKFLVQSVVPLVTLAVGYYLGDRNRNQSQSD